MSQPLETGYVEIVPDFSGFAREVRTGLRVEMARLEIEVRDAANAMERAITSAARNAGQALARDIGLGAAAAKLALHAVGDEGTLMSRRVRKVARDAKGDIEQIVSRGFLRLLADGFAQVGQFAGQLVQQIAKIPPLFALIAVLIPPIIALASALTDVVGIIGVLPASIAVLLATVIPAVVAFQNFGTAMSLLAQGTPKTQAELDKLNEALGKLAPSARVVARELVGLNPILKDIQRATQQAFFQPLQGVFPQLANILAGPIKNGFQTVAIALGGMVAKLVGFFTLAENFDLINGLFQSTARIINSLSKPLVEFFVGMGEAITGALPFVERLATAFGAALTSFSAFIEESVRTGSFQKFIEDSFTTLKELGALIKSVGGFLGTLFAGTNESGHDLIQTLTEMFDRLNAFLQTAEGQDALKELVFLVKAFGVSLAASIDLLIFSQQIFSNFIDALEMIGRAFVGGIKIIGDFFSKIPGVVGGFVAQIPETIGQIFDAAFDTIFTGIGNLIGIGLFAIQELPNQIAQFISSIPDRIVSALEATGPSVGNLFTELVDNAKQILVDGFNDIVDLVKSVPDRIAAIGPFLLNAGANLIQSFINGFRRVGTFIGDVAGDIVGSVKGFLNKAIDKINTGIAQIDAVLPGDLGRIPRLAAGGLALGPAMIAEAGKPEIALPLNDPRAQRAIQQAIGDLGGSGTNITFTPGSISISFEGGTPTADQARSVGRAVGDGILNQLTARQVQLAVRAM